MYLRDMERCKHGSGNVYTLNVLRTIIVMARSLQISER